ncbi:50S ribosomal protein L25/general stress protein Ctc [Ornithobacterium rhinotracheale]|uniref:50S ribosomal protein L25/general stress protein Ctc n=1 Tax=Ornithobacterium rhinotracheale TaxID=28251 RepID=UPI00129CCE81|nr:50S ribosomal protein L25/general stress protein Ctc [Ornithobacterium rhinotracheale]MRI63514.1 50S ribosomal protein L25/general stress protein Ctc [Ornithobacterium rhinotracheale]
MKSLTIQGKKRESVGKASTRALRNAEQVPCVVYGEAEPIHFSADVKSFKNLVYTPEAHIVVLKLDGGETINCVLQDIQFHPVTDAILHADFYQITDDKPVTMNIPVRLEGRARGVMAGGVLRFNLRRLKVRALPANLPDEVVVDITKMRIGHKKYIKDIRVDEYTLMHPDSDVVCLIKNSRTAVGGAADDDDDEEEEGEENAAETSEESNEAAE